MKPKNSCMGLCQLLYKVRRGSKRGKQGGSADCVLLILTEYGLSVLIIKSHSQQSPFHPHSLLL